MKLVRTAAGACAAAMMLAACSEPAPTEITLPSPSPSVEAEPEPEPEPSPTPEDPFAVPAEITPEYIERVLNEINRLDAEITKDILRMPIDENALELPEDLQDRLEAIYAEPVRTLNGRAKADLLRSRERRDGLLPEDVYTQILDTVEQVLSTDSMCAIVRNTVDLSGTDAQMDNEKTNVKFSFLLRSPQANTTGWRLASVVGSDAEPGSADEEEMRAYSVEDLVDVTPEVCR